MRPSGDLSDALSGGNELTRIRVRSDSDLRSLSNPSSLLFAVEKPNIFKDDLLEVEIAPYSSVSDLEAYEQRLGAAVSASNSPHGPLGWAGNELYCKLKERTSSSLGRRLQNVL